MYEEEHKLQSLLTGQTFDTEISQNELLEEVKRCACGYAKATNGIAALSDFQNNAIHIYSGLFGQVLGLPEYVKHEDSAFEREVFDYIPHEELMERHILELRFFHFLKSIPIHQRTDFNATCIVHFQRWEMLPISVLHTTRYLLYNTKGSVQLGLCTYIPFPENKDLVEGCIVNDRTGEIVSLKHLDSQLLSRRQTEILSLLAKGLSSKQIADKLFISVNTVSRHRQDILLRLNVTNTASAVEIGLRMRLI